MTAWASHQDANPPASHASAGPIPRPNANTSAASSPHTNATNSKRRDNESVMLWQVPSKGGLMRWCLRGAAVAALALVYMSGNWFVPALSTVVMLGAYAFTGARA